MKRREFLRASACIAAAEIASHAVAAPTVGEHVTPFVAGTYRQLGTQTLADFLRTVRARLPEGLDAANSRLKPAYGILAYCGATVWRDRYSLGIAGGHGDSHDDGHYAQNLATGQWELLLPPSSVASAAAVADAFGEWLPNRPASQHSYNHLITVDDDIIQGTGYAIANAASGSPQAHRWSNAANAWQRYGSGGNYRPVPHTVLHDAARNRIVRFAHESGRSVDVIPDDDPNAVWTTVATPWWPPIGITASIGLHADLNVFVLIDEVTAPGQAWFLDAQLMQRGWQRLAVVGTSPRGAPNTGLEYVPPMRALAAASLLEPDALYFLEPTGAAGEPWNWTRERFVTSPPPARWEVNPGVPIAPYGRVKWSALANGLVMIKSALARTEIFTPSALVKAVPRSR